MILVTVGTLDKPFDRLVKGIDQIANIAGEKILAQIGCSSYIPEHCDYFRFCEREEMLSYIQKASIIISQAGFATIGNTIRFSKPLIIVPREAKYGEAIDKQYELAEYLASTCESILCVRDVSRLANAIKEIRNVNVSYNFSTTIPDIINEFITDTFFMKD